ncbi:MAG: flagellar basal body rod protein FlgB [Proteobacteria bacterium]|nr:flagellar basal body rod protein FlgB [Pseudomonadota bacterium]
MLSKLDEHLRFHATELNLRAQRQEILSSNIANADTPNYKARDIDFNRVLQDRIAKTQAAGLSQSSLSLRETHETHLPSNAQSGDLPLLYRPVRQASADGNTVDMDVERAQFAENALRYQISVVQASGGVKSMLAVLQG